MDAQDRFGALIGDMPLLELRRFGERRNLRARIFAKVEALNPAGSIKDRTAWGIVRAAEAEGRLVPGQLLVDLTSGNTGIGLAALAAARGYRAKFYLRASTSTEKVALIHRYGAETVPIDDAEFLAPGGVDAIIARVRSENPDAFYTDQRADPANPRIHHDTTGPEIWRDTDGAVDVLVAAVGTGGTISGTGRFLKARKPGLRVAAVEPGPDSVPTPERPQVDTVEGVHRVTGVEPRLLPANFDAGVVDAFIPCETREARAVARALAREEGLFAGPSSGAVLHAAAVLAGRPEHAGQTIVAIVADSGERYLSQDDAIARPRGGPGPA
ncbi:PLP-dependent cysteine synthase family protein [Methylobacterium nonmethylotrophicum]|uniref:cysteine synthase n=1 Tax=Methylobacterium nonmethylotrophicum TaxID=1141884 RepID=A0A4Z0NJJ1_9HYPH|nr:pyridoxal-phosphate dependent enzyme [Methylobacterium nonmethylotrophicum]TGD96180.1 pyridoxal-phosphate dependent enzyme [Methylobacterium nonmethylotrophicum]